MIEDAGDHVAPILALKSCEVPPGLEDEEGGATPGKTLNVPMTSTSALYSLEDLPPHHPGQGVAWNRPPRPEAIQNPDMASEAQVRMPQRVAAFHG